MRNNYSKMGTGVLLSVGLLFGGLAGCGQGEMTRKSGFIAKLQVVKGDVVVLRDGKAAPMAGKVGLILREKDLVQTRANSRAEIFLKNLGMIKVASNSSLRLDELSGNKDKVAVRPKLEAGKILSAVRKMKKGSEFTVSTPTAVAGVRGTAFMVSLEGNQMGGFPFGSLRPELEKLENRVAVINGKVAFRDRKSGTEVFLDRKTELRVLGLQTLEQKLVAPLDKTSVEDLKKLIAVEGEYDSLMTEVAKEIQLSSQLLSQGANGSISEQAEQAGQKLKKNLGVPKVEGKSLEATGEKVEKDYNQEELKLKTDQF